MDTTHIPPARRSYPNLHHLSLGPLTPSYPLPPTDISPSSSPSISQSTSYVIPSSLPPLTPSILSRSSSRTRLRSFHSRPIPTSASSPSFVNNNNNKNSKNSKYYHRNSNSNPLSKPPRRQHRPLPQIEDDTWLLRTASHLTTQTLESKGQSWLATRDSSTSLGIVNAADLADDEYDPYSPEWERSRGQSRLHSPEQSRSRLQSRRGSGADLGMGDGDAIVKADFLESEDEETREDVDEGEMRKIVMGRVGGWVDWAVGWMDFRDQGDYNEGEDGEVLGSETTAEGTVGGAAKIEEGPRRGPKAVKKIVKSEEAEVGVLPPDGEGVGALQDAKWLLDVATNIVL